MKASLKEISKRANVSVATVSLVLNGKNVSIRPETKERVFRAAKALNYVPNRAAVALVTKKNLAIGLIVPDITNVFYALLAKSISLELRKQGYDLLLGITDNQHNEDIRQIEMLSTRVDGIIDVFNDSDDSEYGQTIAGLANGKMPLIMMDRRIESLDVPSVSSDNVQEGYLGTKHLLENGHRRIACIAGAEVSLSGRRRVEGYKKALQEYGVPFDPALVFSGGYRMEGGEAAAERIFDDPGITAVLSCNDMMCLGVCRAARNRGIRIGEDISVVSMDDVIFNSLYEVSITCVRGDIEGLGKKAVDLMMNRLHPERPIEVREPEAPKLVVRESVKNLNKA